MKVGAKFGSMKAGLKEVPTPKPFDDFVLIKIHVNPLCTEYHGFESDREGSSFGHEAAGEVVEVARPGKVKVADRVVVMPQFPCGKCYLCLQGEYIHCRDGTAPTEGKATYAQYCLKQDSILIPIPDGMSYEHASMACCGYGPQFNAMKLMNVGPQDTVLVSGLGAVGLGAVVVSRYRGARVLAVESNPYRTALAKELGAEAVVNPMDPKAEEEIMDLTKGEGVHKSVETSGVGAAKPLLLKVARRKGQVSLIGWGGELDASTIIGKGLTIHGAWHYNLADSFDMMHMIGKIGHQIDKHVTHIFPMSKLQEAWETQLTGNTGKVLMHPWE